jgi:hypothetical protein
MRASGLWLLSGMKSEQIVMPALVAGIHVFDDGEQSRGWPEQVRP